MNILCDLISARQGFNKQQEKFFSPSIPSSLALSTYSLKSLAPKSEPLGGTTAVVKRCCDWEQQRANAQIQSGGLMCPQKPKRSQLIGSIKEWIYPPVISAVASLHLLSSLVPTQLSCTFVVNKSQNVRGEGLQKEEGYVGEGLEMHTAPSLQQRRLSVRKALIYRH